MCRDRPAMSSSGGKCPGFMAGANKKNCMSLSPPRTRLDSEEDIDDFARFATNPELLPCFEI